MKDLQIHLRALEPDLAAAWRDEFAGIPQVEVSTGDIFAEGIRADAIVSPANSFGYMDGGIDWVYTRRFGWDLQRRLQDLLRHEHDGELPVGQAVIIKTEAEDFPYLISAPTMRVPLDVSNTVNAYLAFRATLRVVREFNQRGGGEIRSLLCPGLGTGVGRISPLLCARQMLLAYRAIVLGQQEQHSSIIEVSVKHYILLPTERRTE
jgi:O-acetyl-ADP-ribose deacetylase (regulator of RNase III)